MDFHRGELQGMTKEDILEEMERNKWKKNISTLIKDWRLYVMLLPTIIFFLLFRYLPMVGILIGFRSKGMTVGFSAWDIFYKYDFNGFYYFKRLLFSNQSYEFWRAFRNTFVLSMYGLIFGFPIPIILALFFSEIKNNTYRSITQILTYLPHFISTVIMATMVIQMLGKGNEYFSDGIIASFLYKSGLVKRTNSLIMHEPNYFRFIYQITGIWEGSGYGSIVYFAAIMSISPTSYEAAKIDGANKMAQIRYVTMPGMAPTLTIMLILRIGRILDIGYEKVILLTQDLSSNVVEKADVITTYVYRNAMLGTGDDEWQSIGAAADLFNAVIAMTLVLGSNFISRRISDTSLF